jgi:hypothetical protein
MDYTKGSEMAVLWDTLYNTEINLTQWASDHGILGAFTGNLRRAYAVGVNADGEPVVTGYGFASSVQSGWTGYVLTLPEPASLMLLMLGLPVLHRRR